VTNSPVSYDGTAKSAEVACLGGGTASNILTGGAASQTEVGVYAVTADCAESTNYASATGLAAGNFEIAGSGSSTVTITLAGTGSGTVNSSSNPDSTDQITNCPGTDCTGTYDSGTVVTLLAAASWNSDFIGWTIGCTVQGLRVSSPRAAVPE
jgi:hypothetical protein